MSFNLSRAGSAAVLGLASGVLEGPDISRLTLGENELSYGLVVEAVALVGGGMLQFVSPYTMPQVADGLVEGSLALLGRRGAEYAMSQASAGGTTSAAAAKMLAQRVGAKLPGAWSYAPRAQIGGLNSRVPKVTLS